MKEAVLMQGTEERVLLSFPVLSRERTREIRGQAQPSRDQIEKRTQPTTPLLPPLVTVEGYQGVMLTLNGKILLTEHVF
jgi:hypothetical protein